MTDTTLPPGDGPVDRIEPVDIQQEMQRSYIDYAMSVIVGRALPEVRDGLKPVHRRVLYAMYDSGFRPDRSHAKSARSVAETMGNYHPHGDASIYDTLVRMAQPWSLRYPLVDGQGNFGSPGNDPPAAMRYCVTGDASVALPDGRSVPIADVVPDAKANSDNAIDLKVLDRHGAPVVADRLFHSGEHPVFTVRTVEGHEVTGTANHPLLCLVNFGGVPTLLWKLIEEIRPGDCAVMNAAYVADTQASPRMAVAAEDVPGLEDFLRAYENDADASAIATDLTDGRFYYAKVASVTEAGVQPVYSLRVDTDDHAFLTNGFVSHNTEARLTPLAMEMLREIDEETVDFIPNYDGRVQEPTVLPSRFPNLLANGSGGIAVGMATNIPPHNLRELAEAVFWCLENYDADEEATLTAVMERVKGPDFPTSGLIVGSQGISDAYKTGRGSIRMRGVVEVEEDSRGRTSLVITELPYQVNHDNFITSIAE
ncbi:MAG: DNA gyrase subunit A, partial [Mycobacterium sp.]